MRAFRWRSWLQKAPTSRANGLSQNKPNGDIPPSARRVQISFPMATWQFAFEIGRFVGYYLNCVACGRGTDIDPSFSGARRCFRALFPFDFALTATHPQSHLRRRVPPWQYSTHRLSARRLLMLASRADPPSAPAAASCLAPAVFIPRSRRLSRLIHLTLSVTLG